MLFAELDNINDFRGKIKEILGIKYRKNRKSSSPPNHLPPGWVILIIVYFYIPYYWYLKSTLQLKFIMNICVLRLILGSTMKGKQRGHTIIFSYKLTVIHIIEDNFDVFSQFSCLLGTLCILQTHLI